MIDLAVLRSDPTRIIEGLSKRGMDTALAAELADIDTDRRRLQSAVDAMRSERKRAGRDIAKAGPDDRPALIASMSASKERLEDLEARLGAAGAEVDRLLVVIPNPTHSSVPDGATVADNVVVDEVGDPIVPEPLRDHHELGSALGLVDLERGAKVSGSRFAFLVGDAVKVQLALERLVIDLLAPHGFIPVIPPVLVREAAMYGTGFFPTDEAQIYATAADDLYLVGTSEVALASMHSGEIFTPEELPRRYLGISSCFRREAGTYGKDTRGIFRVHQFDKFEMYSFVVAASSWDEHEFILAREREIFDSLGLVYRVVNVCGGDLGASAAKKYDIEAWLPSEKAYREATSTSNTTDYQARRLDIRVRTDDGLAVVHTLNGTAIAVGRVLTFMLEQFQRPDGTVTMPDVLVERGAPPVLSP